MMKCSTASSSMAPWRRGILVVGGSRCARGVLEQSLSGVLQLDGHEILDVGRRRHVAVRRPAQDDVRTGADTIVTQPSASLVLSRRERAIVAFAQRVLNRVEARFDIADAIRSAADDAGFAENLGV